MPARVLTPQEVRALADAAGPGHGPTIWTAALTGCRPGELGAVRYDAIDREHSRLRISQAVQADGSIGPTKTGRAWWTTFPPSLGQMLSGAPSDVSGLLIDDAGGAVLDTRWFRQLISSASEQSGVEARWYDLRHTWHAWLHAGGVADGFIADCAGAVLRLNDRRHFDVTAAHARAITVLERMVREP